jgi:CRP-like cAMP-binding protein
LLFNVIAVQRFLLFSEIPPEDCERIVAVASQRSYPRGKKIFFEGDPVRRVMLLTTGSVKLVQSSANGDEVILRLVAPGEILSFEYFPGYIHCSTATAVQASSALIWEASQFQALKHRFPILGRNHSCVLLQTLNQLEVRFREVSTDKVDMRLSSQLLRLSEKVGRPSNGHIDIKLSRRDLAQMIGTTIFTVSRLLSLWAEQGIIEPRREAISLLDLPALEELSQTQ